MLTDGTIFYNNEGIESKGFQIRDGLGIKLWNSGRRQVRRAHWPQFAHRESCGPRNWASKSFAKGRSRNWRR